MTTTATATQDNRTSKNANAEVLSSSSAYHQVYTETATHEADVLMQLKSNLAQLEDLHARLRFAMCEITTLIKKS